MVGKGSRGGNMALEDVTGRRGNVTVESVSRRGNVILEPVSRGASEGIQPKIGMALDLLEHHPSISKSNQV